MTEPLAVWMEEAEGWKYVPRESPLYEFCAEAAGCDGRVFANTKLPELVLCDGSDLVLWQMGDVREHEQLLDKAANAMIRVGMETAKLAIDVAERTYQRCAEIADEERKLWSVTRAGVPMTDDAAAAAAAAASIANAIRADVPQMADTGPDAEHGGGDEVQEPTDRAGIMTRTPKRSCPSCGYQLNAASLAMGEHAAPSPGDITVCFNCGHLMAFADDLTARELTDEEAYEVAGDERILAIQRARGAIGVHGKLWPPAKPPAPTGE